MDKVRADRLLLYATRNSIPRIKSSNGKIIRLCG